MGIEAAYIVPHPPLIIPAVGQGEEEKISATMDAYGEVARQVAEIAPDLVIVVSPHATSYRSWFHVSPGRSAKGDLRNFGARGTDMKVPYDAKFTKHLDSLCAREDFPAGTAYERDPRLDHATYIPLWFLDKHCDGYKVARVGVSGLGELEHYQMGRLLAQCAEDLGRRTVLIASGDLSHKLADDGPYGFAPEGPVFDERVTEAMAEGDFMGFFDLDGQLREGAAACGIETFQIMAGALSGTAVEPSLLSYEAPFGVGYAVAAFQVTKLDGSRCLEDLLQDEQEEEPEMEQGALEDPYVRLARTSIEHFVQTGSAPELPDRLPREMTDNRGGAFVSIHEDGQLRGCIGTIAPTAPCLAEEIVHNSVAACAEDPRFAPVRADEIDALAVSVDVLGPLETVDDPSDLDPARYGVVVESGGRRGVLLPGLEGVETADEQLRIARKKAGIGAHGRFEVKRFEVERHE